MRHHLALLQGLASKGLINEINDYLQTVQSDIDAITPIRYCENETVNLIISSFAAKAKQWDIILSVKANLTELLTSSDTEICSYCQRLWKTQYMSAKKFPIKTSKEQEHGYGNKSIAHIVEKHSGVFQFSVKGGWFIFQATA